MKFSMENPLRLTRAWLTGREEKYIREYSVNVTSEHEEHTDHAEARVCRRTDVGERRRASASVVRHRAPTIAPIRSIVGRPIVHWVGAPVEAPVPSLVPRGGAYPGAKFRSSVRVHKRERDLPLSTLAYLFFPMFLLLFHSVALLPDAGTYEW